MQIGTVIDWASEVRFGTNDGVGCVAALPHSRKKLDGQVYFNLPAELPRQSEIGSVLEASASRGVAMSFQITILKVLAGHPEGRASLADLKRAMAILISSGSDWTDRTKRLAARAPNLDIFSQSFVLRDNAGWQITDAGRAFLDFLQTPIQPTSDDRKSPDVTAIPILPPAASPITLVGVGHFLGWRAVGDLPQPHEAPSLIDKGSGVPQVPQFF
jgi:hypothetical protein